MRFLKTTTMDIFSIKKINFVYYNFKISFLRKKKYQLLIGND